VDNPLKASKIADELIGMLNADGGVLVFGIADNGELQDLAVLGEKLNDYRKLIFDYITPPCNIELEEIEIDNKLIFVFHVEQDLERVFFRKDNDKAFLRIADSNKELSRDDIKKLEYDKNIRRFEEEVVADFDLEDLDNDLLEMYRQRVGYQGNGLDLLNKKHLVNKKNDTFQFKKSAILLFSKDPEKYIPSASVRYVRYDGTQAKTGTEHNVIKDQRFENNIPRLIDEVSKFIRIALKDYYFLDKAQGRFLKVPEYPEEAWLEAIVNALCHRSYNVQGNAIYIKHFYDRLEISNSGPLPAQVTVENIRTERFARNPRIARVLEDFGYVRQLNEGVDRIYQAMEKSMLSVPEYQQRNNNIYLILKNKISNNLNNIPQSVFDYIQQQWSDFNNSQQDILQYFFLHNQATVTQLEQNLQVSDKTIRRYLNAFVENGIMERLSDKQRDPNAVYRFKRS